MEKFFKKKILITGGLGFIGSALARRLISFGSEVVIVDNLFQNYGGNIFNVNGVKEKLDIHIVDIRESAALYKLIKDCSILFNLAGQTSHLDSMSDPITDLEINSKAQLSLLEICKNINRDIKIVYASTRQIYGKPSYFPVDELHPLNPVDVNGINKLSGEMFHILYGKTYGINSSVLRLTNTYGPGMRIKDAKQTFLGIWVRSLIEGRPITIYGDGYQLRDFNYVDDCLDALLSTAVEEAASGKIYNLGSNEVVNLNRLASILVEVGDVSAPIMNIDFPRDREKIDIGDYYGDYSLINQELGWSPQVNLHQGLSQTIAYYKEHFFEYV
jgi:UDP-glucose 4-epimerase